MSGLNCEHPLGWHAYVDCAKRWECVGCLRQQLDAARAELEAKKSAYALLQASFGDAWEQLTALRAEREALRELLDKAKFAIWEAVTNEDGLDGSVWDDLGPRIEKALFAPKATFEQYIPEGHHIVEDADGERYVRNEAPKAEEKPDEKGERP